MQPCLFHVLDGWVTFCFVTLINLRLWSALQPQPDVAHAALTIS